MTQMKATAKVKSPKPPAAASQPQSDYATNRIKKFKTFLQKGSDGRYRVKGTTPGENEIRLSIDKILLGEVELEFRPDAVVRFEPIKVRTIAQLVHKFGSLEKISEIDANNIAEVVQLFTILANQSRRGPEKNEPTPFTEDDIADLLDMETLPVMSILLQEAMNPFIVGSAPSMGQTEQETTLGPNSSMSSPNNSDSPRE